MTKAISILRDFLIIMYLNRVLGLTYQEQIIFLMGAVALAFWADWLK